MPFYIIYFENEVFRSDCPSTSTLVNALVVVAVALSLADFYRDIDDSIGDNKKI